jgi:hypothetical protein
MSAKSKEQEIRLSVDQQFLDDLKQQLGVERATDVTRSALTLLHWAASEVANGRVILSASNAGADVHRLVMPELTAAKRG